MAWATGVDPTLAVSVYSSGYGYGPNQGLTKEDLLDLITNIDPWDNIVFAMLPKRRARSTTHEWPVDTLMTVSRAGVLDGAAFTAQGMTQPLRLKNYTQIFRWDAQVTGTEEAVDTAGIGDKLAYQILNGTHALAKAVEQRIFDIGTGSATTGTFTLDLAGSLTGYAGLIGTTGPSAVPGYGGAAATGGSGTVRRMAPLFNLIPQTGLGSFSWTSPIVDMANTTLTATKVDDLCEIMFANGLKPETLVLNQGSKRDLANDLIAASGANALNTRLIQASERKVIRGVDVYEGELTTLSVIPNRSIAMTSATSAGYGSAWVLQKDKLGIAFLRPIKAVPLSVRGDSTEKMLIGELTIENLHPVGAGVIIRVTS